MNHFIFSFLLLIMMAAAACNAANEKQQEASGADTTVYKQGTFGYDLRFLKQHDSVVVLQSDGGQSQIIVSPKYQAKVFTSTTEGNKGLSFGWVNYKAFTGPLNEHMNGYGGENRLWLGPEGGRFSLYFKLGSEMVFDNWKTPAAFDTEAWEVVAKNANSVALQKKMMLTNYKGTPLMLLVDREISMLHRQKIAAKTGVSLNEKIKAVGYETRNRLTNTGPEAWTAESGMPCLWVLDMFKPTPSTTIIIPFKNAAGQPLSTVATTNYFGEIPAGRLKHTDTILYFKADGKSRGKLGILPGKAKPVAGSYDAENKVLTITLFDVSPDAPYLNQEWNTSKPPFSGDAVNAYNDGPLKDGTQMGPFYEIESVSPAALLAPGQSLLHHHSVFHFTGAEDALDAIVQKMFGVALSDVKKAF